MSTPSRDKGKGKKPSGARLMSPSKKTPRNTLETGQSSSTPARTRVKSPKKAGSASATAAHSTTQEVSQAELDAFRVRPLLLSEEEIPQSPSRIAGEQARRHARRDNAAASGKVRSDLLEREPPQYGERNARSEDVELQEYSPQRTSAPHTSAEEPETPTRRSQPSASGSASRPTDTAEDRGKQRQVSSQSSGAESTMVHTGHAYDDQDDDIISITAVANDPRAKTVRIMDPSETPTEIGGPGAHKTGKGKGTPSRPHGKPKKKSSDKVKTNARDRPLGGRPQPDARQPYPQDREEMVAERRSGSRQQTRSDDDDSRCCGSC